MVILFISIEYHLFFQSLHAHLIYKQLQMTHSDISTIRAYNQQLNQSQFSTAKELVGYMGAMQAQDFPMARWAVGLRLAEATDKTIEAAYNNGEIIRTHVMRPTWHFVSPADIYWMIELTAPRIKPLLKSGDLKLELTPKLLNKCYQLIENELSSNGSITRGDLKQLFENAKINTDENRLSHIMMNAELDSLVCSGPLKNTKLTFALLSERVPHKQTLSKDESLAELAKRYFSSHGPATIQDFVWWSGLSVSDAKKSIEINKNILISETIENEVYWFSNLSSLQTNQSVVHFLPAFDEILISYRNRNAIINTSHNKKAISDNGIFRPIIVVNGHVAGIWRRATKKNRIEIEISLFFQHDNEIISLIEYEVSNYVKFINMPAQLTWSNQFMNTL